MLSKNQVKYIQSLNQKKFRQENGVFVAEGPKIISELLAGKNTEPVAIFGDATWWQDNEDLKNEIPFVAFHQVSTAELERISFLSTPHQVLGIFKEPRFTAPADPGTSLTLLLENIQDPGNMGTIIRIADWFGIKQVIASKESADIFNPKVVQSTMGSLARVAVKYEHLPEYLQAHPAVRVFAATLDGKPLQAFGKVHAGMLLIGNESRGISKELLLRCTDLLTIPKYGAAESLNAAVATGIILSHLV